MMIARQASQYLYQAILCCILAIIFWALFETDFIDKFFVPTKGVKNKMSAQHAMMVGGNSNNSNPGSQVNSPRFSTQDVPNANQSFTTNLQDRVPAYGPVGRDVVVPSINLASLEYESVHALTREQLAEPSNS